MSCDGRLVPTAESSYSVQVCDSSLRATEYRGRDGKRDKHLDVKTTSCDESGGDGGKER